MVDRARALSSSSLSPEVVPLQETPFLSRWDSALGHIVGITLLVCGIGMLLSALVELLYGGGRSGLLLACGVLVTLLGGVLWRLTETPQSLRRSTVYLTVAFCWFTCSIVGTLPYLLTGVLDNFFDALFESVSGFTTTGATLFSTELFVSMTDSTDGSTLEPGLMFWRSITQWFGGIGVVVLAVSVLPFLGVGGLDLLEAEAPGPSSERLVPRLRDTARYLLWVYLSVTVMLVVLYLAGSMSVYDAIVHAFTTVSTGGFSPHLESMAYFDSPYIVWVCSFGMFLAGGSFALYARAFSGSVPPLLRSAEFRAYVVFVLGATLSIVCLILINSDETLGGGLLREALFTVLAFATTTGYGLVDFLTWPEGPQAILMFLLPVGAMAGSTAGGVKIIRVMSVVKYARREVWRQLHPAVVQVVKIGKDPIPESVMRKIVGFVIFFVLLWFLGTLLVAATGADFDTALSTAGSSIGNVGPGVADNVAGGDFTSVPWLGRLVLIALMLLGRLEIFPLLLALRALADRSDLGAFLRRGKGIARSTSSARSR